MPCGADGGLQLVVSPHEAESTSIRSNLDAAVLATYYTSRVVVIYEQKSNMLCPQCWAFFFPRWYWIWIFSRYCIKVRNSSVVTGLTDWLGGWHIEIWQIQRHWQSENGLKQNCLWIQNECSKYFCPILCWLQRLWCRSTTNQWQQQKLWTL